MFNPDVCSVVHWKMSANQIFSFSWYFKQWPQAFIFIKTSVVVYFSETLHSKEGHTPFHNWNPWNLNQFWLLEKCLILIISPLLTKAKTAQITFAQRQKEKSTVFKPWTYDSYSIRQSFCLVPLWIGNVGLYLWRM